MKFVMLKYSGEEKFKVRQFGWKQKEGKAGRPNDEYKWLFAGDSKAI